MINLPNKCTCSNISLHPKNWNSKDAKASIDWYIMYRFYDPNFEKPKLIILKGMNQFKGLSDRQEATKTAISSELNEIVARGI